MARGHIGERQRLQFDPSAFLQRGGGDNKDDTAMAMAIMGYGKGTSPQDQALDAQKQAWAEKYQAGQLSIEELKQKAAEANYKSEAEARTAAISDTAQKRMDEAAKEAAREKEAAAQLEYYKTKADRDAAVEVFKNAVEHGGLKELDPQGKPNPMYNILAEAAMPGFTEKSAKAKKGIFEQDVNAALNKYQALDPKKRALVDKNPGGAGIPADVYNEVLKRINVQPSTSPVTSLPGEGRMPLSRFTEQNVPTAPSSDIFSEAGVRIGLPTIDARDYSKFPGSVEDLIRASNGQPLPESLFAGPKTVVAPPTASAPTSINMPKASVESVAPGLNMPREEFNAIPEVGQYQPGAAFSRQGLPDLHLIPEPYVRPQTDLMVDELLKRLRMGGGDTNVPMPIGSEYPFPGQGVFQPHPG